MAAGSNEEITQSSHFYRDYFQSIVVILIIAIFLILAMVFVVLYQILHRPLPEFVAVAQNNQRMVLTPFHEPNTMPSTLLKWASKAAVASYTFDFVNYNRQMVDAATQYFTPSGWYNYQTALNALIAQIVQKQLFVNGVVAGPPVISQQGLISRNQYAWRIQIPFLVTYQTAEVVRKENFLVILTIVKIPTNEDPIGIGIDQFVMRSP